MLTFLATVPLLPLIGILTGAAHGFLYPALSVLVISITTEQHRGRVVGLFSSAVLLGHTLGAIAMGYVVHAFGYPAMFGFLSFLLFAGAALSLRLGQ
jgi:predicted MFS family arabinose efflux permease